MATATTGEALLQAILDDPGDDLPRLAYADWLEENDQAERAEFIRVQVELAKVPEERKGGLTQWSSDEAAADAVRADDPRVERLRRKEAGLLTHSRFWDWFGDSSSGWYSAWSGMPAVEIAQNVCEVGYFDHKDKPHWKFTVRRGFIGGIELPQQAWLDHGPAIVRAHPVVKVTLSDAWPGLDSRIRDLTIKNVHDTHEEMMSAINIAALLWAKRESAKEGKP